jgi:hypothetical protein
MAVRLLYARTIISLAGCRIGRHQISVLHVCQSAGDRIRDPRRSQREVARVGLRWDCRAY